MVAVVRDHDLTLEVVVEVAEIMNLLTMTLKSTLGVK